MENDFKLQKALGDLYRVFSGYEMPQHVEMSPYRNIQQELGALRSKRLQEVEPEEIDSYAGHALTTVGNLDLLKYALPRLLEVVAQRTLMTNPEIVLGKLAYGGWRTWPEREQATILMFLQSWWAHVL